MHSFVYLQLDIITSLPSVFTAALFMEIYLATGKNLSLYIFVAVVGYFANLVILHILTSLVGVSCIQGVHIEYVATPHYLRRCF